MGYCLNRLPDESFDDDAVQVFPLGFPELLTQDAPELNLLRYLVLEHGQVEVSGEPRRRGSRRDSVLSIPACLVGVRL